MSRYPKSFNSKQYPKFIRKSLLQLLPKPVKVFHKIGLPNCEQSLDSINICGKALIFSKLQEIADSLYTQSEIISMKKHLGDLDDFLTDICDLHEEICYEADGNGNGFISNNKLIVPIHIKLRSISITKNESLFDVLDKLINYGVKNKINMSALQKLKPSFKTAVKATQFSPFKKKNLKVCFSSDGNKGFWDIATMSMRKISSCMNWKSDNARSLVGSLADPYAGIIYITDSSHTKYGKAMLARAVVRFVVNKKNKPALLIEEIYTPSKGYSNIYRIFSSFLYKKTGLTIIGGNSDGNYDEVYNYSIPYSEATELISETDTSQETLSYRDSEIEYIKNKKFYNPLKIKILAKDLTNR